MATEVATHTTGPWRIGDHPYDIVAEEYRRVATVAHDRQGLNRGKEESDANARLIAAAPTMLQALREVAGDYIYLDPEYGPECSHCAVNEGHQHEFECTIRTVLDAIADAIGAERRAWIVGDTL